MKYHEAYMAECDANLGGAREYSQLAKEWAIRLENTYGPNPQCGWFACVIELARNQPAIRHDNLKEVLDILTREGLADAMG